MKATTKRKTAARGASARQSSNRQKVRRLSMFDRFLRTLPLAEAEIQRIFNWIAIGTFLVILFFVARYFGLGAIVHNQYAELAAKAGFVVTRVETSGMERVDQLKVYDIVLAEKDRAMPLVDLEKIRSDLMQYGWIKDVRVSRRLPDTLVVEIIERKPAAIWNQGGKQTLIDEAGVVLQNVPVGSVGGLMILNGENANKQAVMLAELLDEAPSLKPQIVAASWIGNRRWDLTFKTGETVALPEGEKPATKALIDFARMDGVSRLLGQDMIYFDLRDPDRAYIRKKPKEEPKPVKDDSAKKDEGRSDGDTAKIGSDEKA
ncbi:cell division protein FtsQ/DivIB [Sphingorhabdus arenilitoris]|uniref:Cell division protein FtsQ n=2 Tax=Sphingorhabdus arenilitoris TaxID=1490041 RepID=A0ABV8RHQ4_9SPHN